MSANNYEQAFVDEQDLKYLKPGENDLEKLIFESDLGNTEYVKKEELEALLKSCKWVGTATEFLYMVNKSRSTIRPSGTETVLLGLTAFAQRKAFKDIFGALDWSDGFFDKHGISMAFENWPEHFAEALAEDDDVKNIVFLVPDRALSFYDNHKHEEKMPSARSTEKELGFFLKNPHLAKKVMLVFGVGDLINTEEATKIDGIDKYGAPKGSRVKYEGGVEKKIGDGFSKLTEVLTGVKIIKQIEDGYEIMDKIVDFETSLHEISNIKQNPGHIPKLGHIFLPLNNRGFEDESLLGKTVLYKKDYVDWAPRKIIDSKRLNWRERYHSVAYFQDTDAKAIMDEWMKEGTFEDNENKLRQQNIDANIVRLLTHTNAPACKDFALCCMRFVAESESYTLFRLFPTIGGDGDDGGQFWTIGPYILEALKEERFLSGEAPNDEQDFLKVLTWMKSRKIAGEWGHDAIYPGVGDLRREIHSLYLPRDGFHPIHAFVSKIGKHIARNLENIYVEKNLLIKGETRVRRYKV